MLKENVVIQGSVSTSVKGLVVPIIRYVLRVCVDLIAVLIFPVKLAKDVEINNVKWIPVLKYVVLMEVFVVKDYVSSPVPR